MKRKIIKIDETKCNGCGQCIPNCPEGALQIIDGKARVVSEISCDGLGACVGHCPLGAMSVEEREAAAYDEKAVMENIVKAGAATIKAHLEHLYEHNELDFLKQAIEYLKEHDIDVPEYREKKSPVVGGCPGSKAFKFDRKKRESSNAGPVNSELNQWPVQLSLVNPAAQFFDDADLLIAADCVAFSFGDFHRRFLKGKVLVVFCPKLDDRKEAYIDRLAEIFKTHHIRSVTVVRMEVPCCGGTGYIVEEALKKSGIIKTIKEYTISLQGEII